MPYLIILNDPPYGTERSYNGLRLAITLQKREDLQLSIFLMADTVLCAKRGQKTPDGYYNLERMLKGLTRRAAIGACGSCLDARDPAGARQPYHYLDRRASGGAQAAPRAGTPGLPGHDRAG